MANVLVPHAQIIRSAGAGDLKQNAISQVGQAERVGVLAQIHRVARTQRVQVADVVAAEAERHGVQVDLVSAASGTSWRASDGFSMIAGKAWQVGVPLAPEAQAILAAVAHVATARAKQVVDDQPARAVSPFGFRWPARWPMASNRRLPARDFVTTSILLVPQSEQKGDQKNILLFAFRAEPDGPS
jgi:hypothetical protein